MISGWQYIAAVIWLFSDTGGPEEVEPKNPTEPQLAKMSCLQNVTNTLGTRAAAMAQ